jgi:hypothetical protein
MDSRIANLVDNFSYEELAHALYLKGERDGYPKVTDKTKWRELVMAEKLQHVAFEKISAGKNSDKYGADAYEADGKTAEYKSKAIDDKEVRNLTEQIRSQKTAARYAALSVAGVYNGAYTQEAIDSYAEHNHYFGVFHKERCVLIIKPQTEYVIQTLTSQNAKRLEKNKLLIAEGKDPKTTNANSVIIKLDNTDIYETVFKDEEWFKENK